MKRQKHSLSNYNILSCDMGQLVPVQVIEILPGDSMQFQTSAFIRVNPLLAPVMHPVTVRFHHWFVPNRLIWPKDGLDTGWEPFITGGHDNSDAQTVPTNGVARTAKDMLDYMGLDPNVSVGQNGLPVRAVNMIWNEFYRDQDLGTIRDENDITVPLIAWEKDYLTTARPWTQKGAEITLPLTGDLPVRGIGVVGAHSTDNPAVTETGGATPNYPYHYPTSDADQVHIESSVAGVPAIYADLASATGITVNDLRESFALQRFAEARSKYGSRYVEYLKYCGVNPSDSRLQRPEYLGGGKQVIQFSEVIQTAVDATDPVGTLRGHGTSAMRTRKTRKYFEEHGHVITLMSVRPKAIYQGTVDRKWSRADKEDFFQKELQFIGDQTIKNKEVYGMHASPNGTFGYGARYSEYGSERSRVTSEFRSTFATPLDYWHLAREHSAGDPALNEAFIECEVSKRIHSEQTLNSLWCMVNNSVIARRLVAKNTRGSIR